MLTNLKLPSKALTYTPLRYLKYSIRTETNLDIPLELDCPFSYLYKTVGRPNQSIDDGENNF